MSRLGGRISASRFGGSGLSLGTRECVLFLPLRSGIPLNRLLQVLELRAEQERSELGASFFRVLLPRSLADGFSRCRRSLRGRRNQSCIGIGALVDCIRGTWRASSCGAARERELSIRRPRRLEDVAKDAKHAQDDEQAQDLMMPMRKIYSTDANYVPSPYIHVSVTSARLEARSLPDLLLGGFL